MCISIHLHLFPGRAFNVSHSGLKHQALECPHHPKSPQHRLCKRNLSQRQCKAKTILDNILLFLRRQRTKSQSEHQSQQLQGISGQGSEAKTGRAPLPKHESGTGVIHNEEITLGYDESMHPKPPESNCILRYVQWNLQNGAIS